MYEMGSISPWSKLRAKPVNPTVRFRELFFSFSNPDSPALSTNSSDYEARTRSLST